MVVTLDTPDGVFVDSSNMASLTIASPNTGVLEWVVCSDRSGRLRLEGTGWKASWSGVQSCPSPISSCPGATTVFRSASFEMTSTTSLKEAVSGTVLACGETAGLKLEFSGTK